MERFGILDDIDYCYELIDQRKKKIVDTSDQLRAAEKEYRQVTADLAPIDELLKRKRESVSFAEFVSAVGYKEIITSISDDINSLVAKESDVSASLLGLEDDLKVDSNRKRDIYEYYQSRMKEFLSELSVDVLKIADYKSFDRHQRSRQ